jgi:superfamily I DNA and/or RNA helicase
MRRENLEDTDIGVISPYLARLAQLKKLKEALSPRWPRIKMGTAEKRVIIISTVKSMGGIVFLSNEKVNL